MLKSFLPKSKLRSRIPFKFTSRDRIAPSLLDTLPHDNQEWTQIASAESYRAALNKNGEVFEWGSHHSANLQKRYSEDIIKSARFPTKVEGLDGLVITKISCGQYNTAALTDKGKLIIWYVPSIIMTQNLNTSGTYFKSML